MTAIRKACDIVGGITAMAKELNIKPPSISEWITKGIAPPTRILSIEKATGGKVTRYELRPDIYPPEDQHNTTGSKQ